MLDQLLLGGAILSYLGAPLLAILAVALGVAILQFLYWEFLA